MRTRKWHFVIHNQGDYDFQKKEDLLTLFRSRYAESLEGYLISQEMYPENPKDSHLQGNIFFKNPVYKTALLTLLKPIYTLPDQESIGRVELQVVKHEGRARSYMIDSTKEGGDRFPISDESSLDARKFREWLDRQIQEGIQTNIALLAEN